jgi:hypothetical protein
VVNTTRGVEYWTSSAGVFGQPIDSWAVRHNVRRVLGTICGVNRCNKDVLSGIPRRHAGRRRPSKTPAQ